MHVDKSKLAYRGHDRVVTDTDYAEYLYALLLLRGAVRSKRLGGGFKLGHMDERTGSKYVFLLSRNGEKDEQWVISRNGEKDEQWVIKSKRVNVFLNASTNYARPDKT